MFMPGSSSEGEVTGFHGWTKYFLLEQQTRQAKLLLQPLNLPGTRSSVRPLPSTDGQAEIGSH